MGQDSLVAMMAQIWGEEQLQRDSGKFWKWLPWVTDGLADNSVGKCFTSPLDRGNSFLIDAVYLGFPAGSQKIIIIQP